MSKFYVTTPIYYVNAPPHLGHAYADVIADVLARYHRLQGEEVWFLTGTDEHGAKIVRAAEKAKEKVEIFVADGRRAFQKLAQKLNISNDDFIFTADKKRHFPSAQYLWKKLVEAGDIYKGNYEGLYCLGHEAFITEKELVDGKCLDHDEKPQILKEENYFFKLSKYGDEIRSLIEAGELRILPEGRKNEILSLIDAGLKDISFSRPSKDISWGVPVPDDKSQTMYVWADALSNYLSALGYGQKDDSKFKKFWPADVHLFGKEILRFHAAIWPAMLLSARLPLPKTVLCHGLIQAGDRKMSKTLGNVVDPFELIQSYGSDALRCYFLREIPIFGDGDFTLEKFSQVYEGNLVNGLGNYIQRVSTMARNYFGESLSKPAEAGLLNVPLKKGEVEYVSVEYFIQEVVYKEYKKAMDGLEPGRALESVFGLLKALDGYVQDYEPFKLIKADKEKTRAVLWNLCYGAASLGWFLLPFLPQSAQKISDIFGVSGKPEKEWEVFAVKEHAPLFPRLER